jgi:hypothetical protein
MEYPSVLWKRLDTSGTDACRFVSRDEGWAIEGQANFVHEGAVACLSYSLLCAPDWTSRLAVVNGWVGHRPLSLVIERSDAAGWQLNGQAVPGSEALLDVDLGFTPASNTNAIRRLGLGIGDRTETTALWLDSEDWTLKPLVQSYHRTSATTFAYASPIHGYQAELETDGFGVIRSYPDLWVAVR